MALWYRASLSDLVITGSNSYEAFYLFFDNFQHFFQTFMVCHALSCTFLYTKPLPFRRKVLKLPPDIVKTRGLLRLVGKIQA